MNWGSILAVSAAVIFFAAIMYKALKEPLDAVFRLIGRMFGYGASKVSGATASAGEVVTYG